MNERIIEYEPNRIITFEFTSGPIKGSRETYRPEQADEQGKGLTRLTGGFDLMFKGIFKVLGALFVSPGFRKEKKRRG